MTVDEAYRKLLERHRDLQEKMTELAGLAEEVAGAQHQFRRVEAAKFEQLSEALDSSWEDYQSARRRFGRALQGE